MKDHLLEGLRNACWWQGLLVESRGPAAAFDWPKVQLHLSLNDSRFVLSGTKNGFCELLVPMFLLGFVKCVAPAGLGPKAGH